MKARPPQHDESTPHSSADPAEQVWMLLQQFVESHSPRSELADALGFRLGAGRGKFLFQLRDGPLTLSQLAAANGFDAPYATLVADKLEAHGLIERSPHPDDRRRKLVALTAAGHAAVAAAETIRRQPPQAVRALGVSDQRRLADLLHRLIQFDDRAKPEK